MTVAKIKTASGWQDISIAGPQGPVGPTGATGPPGTPTDATASAKGILQLAGDLAGSAAVPKITIPEVAALPASPIEGQICAYAPSITNYPIWYMRWGAARWGGRWEFIGGTPYIVAIATDQTFADTGGNVDAATAGPTLTLPNAGDWLITTQANIYIATQAALRSVGHGATASSGTWDETAATGWAIFTGAEVTSGRGIAGEGRMTLRGAAAGATVKQQYYAETDTGTAHCRQRSITAIPLKLI